MVNMEKKPKYIEPDTIKAPKIFYDVTIERPRPPSAKNYFGSRASSVLTDVDFDYGAAIGFQPEEWPYSNKYSYIFKNLNNVAEFLMISILLSESVFSGLGEIEVTAVTSDSNLKTGNGRTYSSPLGRIRFREVHT